VDELPLTVSPRWDTGGDQVEKKKGARRHSGASSAVSCEAAS
jgi:hypothetical protein